MTTTRSDGGEKESDRANPDPIALAQELVRTPSVNPALEAGGSGEAEIAHLTSGWLKEWGFEVEVQEVSPGRYNTLGRTGKGRGRTLLMNGHLDTVGVAGMTVAPFDGAIRDGRLEGRGACDMKAGVASLLSAGARLAGNEVPGQLIIALTADEEHSSTGMQALVDAGVRADAAVVCEPTDLAVMPANKGFVWLTLDFTGRAAHGSRPDVGIDAIRHAAQYLAGLDGYEVRLKQRPPHPLLGHPSFHAGTIQGGVAPSVYPEKCRLVIERRTLPDEDPEVVVGEFSAMLEGVSRAFPNLEAHLIPGLARPGTEVREDSDLVQGLLAACAEGELEPRVEGMSAWVDAALLNEAGVPAVCFGPGSIAQAHSADEWVEVDQIKRCARVLELFARSFLAG